MKRFVIPLVIVVSILTVGGLIVAQWMQKIEEVEDARYAAGETEVIISNLPDAPLQLFTSGSTLNDSGLIKDFDGKRIWLRPGNYFLQAWMQNRLIKIPIPLTGYRSGPDEEGAYVISLRTPPAQFPPHLQGQEERYSFIPSGNVLLGDRQNPQEPHYVWLTSYFISQFEATNGEYREFLFGGDGYANDDNWSDAGKKWKAVNPSACSAKLKLGDPNYHRFGEDDQPVTWITWYEANAYCRWLTKKIGGTSWLFSLPTDPEWEKAARGPDNFDYALSRTISDQEVKLYNWKKNPDDTIPVKGSTITRRRYGPNRFGLYHMTGNVSEWSQSICLPYNREHPYVDDERNHDETRGQRSVRGGSWYSASIAYLYISYRDSFQPEHCNQELGFRIVARALP